MTGTRCKVITMKGHGFTDCSRRFGLTHFAWIKAIKRGVLRVTPSRFADRWRQYDWAEIQAHYDSGASYRQCKARFGFHAGAWMKAVERGEVKPRPGAMMGQLLRSGKSRHNIKHRLLRAGLLENRCEECGLTEWQGKPLIVHIDHVNGIKNDHRLENLRMLCPNCHSQTETYGGKKHRSRQSDKQHSRFV